MNGWVHSLNKLWEGAAFLKLSLSYVSLVEITWQTGMFQKPWSSCPGGDCYPVKHTTFHIGLHTNKHLPISKPNFWSKSGKWFSVFSENKLTVVLHSSSEWGAIWQYKYMISSWLLNAGYFMYKCIMNACSSIRSMLMKKWRNE